MKAYHHQEIHQLITQFQTLTLPKTNWTHAAHLIVAVWHNWHYDPLLAFQMVKQRIIAYNEAVGTVNTDTSGYHETLTRFWMEKTGEFLEKHPFSSVEDNLSFYQKLGYTAFKRETIKPGLTLVYLEKIKPG